MPLIHPRKTRHTAVKGMLAGLLLQWPLGQSHTPLLADAEQTWCDLKDSKRRVTYGCCGFLEGISEAHSC
jgi:hypothetical protein